MANFAEIIWSPNHDDRFAVICKSIVFLFKINDMDEPDTDTLNGVKIIGDTYKFKITLLNTYNDGGNIKAFAWKPCMGVKQDGLISPLNLFAIGLSSGNVKLNSLQNVESRHDQFDLNNKELVTRSNRICAFLYWNPWRTTYLAQGLARGRYNRETSILVWDVVRKTAARSPTTVNSSSDFSNAYPGDSLFNADKISITGSSKLKTVKLICDQPLCDACQNEQAHSFAWVSKNSFIVGLSNNYLKLYDISDTAKAIQMTQTRLVYGLTADPLFPARIASFHGNQVGIWNWGNLEKPIYVFTEHKDVVAIRWSPLREGLLGVLLVDSLDIRVYNAQIPYNQPMEETEQFLFEMRATLCELRRHCLLVLCGYHLLEDDPASWSGQIEVQIWLQPPTLEPDCKNMPGSDKASVPLIAFAWHGSVVNCILTIDRSGCLNVAKVHQLTVPTWSPNHTLLWTCDSAWLGLDTTGLFGTFGYAFRRTPPSSAPEAEQLQLLPPFASMEAAKKIPQEALRQFANLSQILDTDLSSVIQKRADSGYGLEVDKSPYSVIVAGDSHLRCGWVLIEYLQQYIEDWSPSGKGDDQSAYGSIRKSYGPAGGSPANNISASPRCQGALGILCGDRLPTSEVNENPEWHGIDATLSFPRYSSPERSRVLRMCMWPLNAASDVQRSVFESVCVAAEYERAAAMALVNLHFDWALSFLSRASEYRRTKNQPQRAEDNGSGSGGSVGAWNAGVSQETDLIGLALSGFSDRRNALWRSTCADVLNRLSNPYLRVMFKFLSCSQNTADGAAKGFRDIIENEGIILIDRLACACLYLNDVELSQFVRSACSKLIAAGSLEAILLTGFSTPEFFDLLQAFLDRTGDVQTTAILGLHACKLCRNPLSHAPPGPTPQTSAAATPTTASTTPRQQHQPSAVPGSRLRPRPGRETLGGRLAVATPPSSVPGDQVAAKMGGRRLANWVESYRDLLDRWRMWFYRVDFDNHYSTRLVSCFAHGSAHVGTRPTTTDNSSAPATSIFQETTAPKPSSNVDHHSGVRAIGLPAAANQIFMACAYCGWRLGGLVRGNSDGPAHGIISHVANASIAGLNPSGGDLTTPTMHGGGGKQTICWHCRKPLPRCAICLMHMGAETGEEEELEETKVEPEPPVEGDKMTATNTVTDGKPLKTKITQSTDASKNSLSNMRCQTSNPQKSPNNFPDPTKHADLTGGDASRGGQLRLASWFVWCQACRHGGHAGHISEWFYGRTAPAPANLIECPVNGCACRCASLDSAVPPPRPQVARHHGPSVNTSKTTAANTDISSVDYEDYTVNSEHDTEILSSDGEETTEAKMRVAPASVPKNRREIVDPFVGIMMPE